jgi:phage-related protein
MSYGGELAADYSYSTNHEYTIVVPVEVDGREFARVTAPYTQEELDRREMRNNRKQGKV